MQDARRELFIDSIDWVHPPAVAPYGASFMFNETYLPAPPIEIERRRAPGKRSHHSPRQNDSGTLFRIGWFWPNRRVIEILYKSRGINISLILFLSRTITI